MRLYKYDPASGAWEAELPERRFRSLETLPDEQGLILDEAGGDRQSWQSRLILRQKGSEKILLEEAEIETPYRMIMPADTAASHLLLRRFADDQAAYRYRALDLAILHSGGMRPNGAARLCALVPWGRANAAPDRF